MDVIVVNDTVGGDTLVDMTLQTGNTVSNQDHLPWDNIHKMMRDITITSSSGNLLSWWKVYKNTWLKMIAYRFWWWAVVFTKCLIFGNIWVEVDHLMTIVDPIRKTPDHQILPGKGLKHGYLLILGGFIYWITEIEEGIWKFNCCLHELQATVTPPSSESENLMRKVPTSLDFRNSSASCLDTNPNNALNKKILFFINFILMSCGDKKCWNSSEQV